MNNDILLDEATKFWKALDPFKGVSDNTEFVVKEVPAHFIANDHTLNTRRFDETYVQELSEAMNLIRTRHITSGWSGGALLARFWGATFSCTEDGRPIGGNHSREAAKQVFGVDVVLNVKIYRGSWDEAYLLATRENATHGRRRTPDELRGAIERWLRHKTGMTYTNRHIADQVDCSHTQVGRVEEQIREQDPDYDRPTRRRLIKNGEEVWIDTEKIGKKSEEELPLLELANKPDDTLTELVDEIEDLHSVLDGWRSESYNLGNIDRHISVNNLLADYANLRAAWKNRTASPIENLETHKKKLEVIRDQYEDADILQETAQNCATYVEQILAWKKDDNEWKKQPIATFCRAIDEEHGVARTETWLRSDKTQFLHQTDIDELDNNEWCLSQALLRLRSNGLKLRKESPPSDRTPPSPPEQPPRQKPKPAPVEDPDPAEQDPAAKPILEEDYAAMRKSLSESITALEKSLKSFATSVIDDVDDALMHCLPDQDNLRDLLIDIRNRARVILDWEKDDVELDVDNFIENSDDDDDSLAPDPDPVKGDFSDWTTRDLQMRLSAELGKEASLRDDDLITEIRSQLSGRPFE